jgi:hypothetical protein
MNKKSLGWLLVLVSIMLLASVDFEIDPNGPPRISTRWEERKMRQQILDESHIRRDSDGNIVEIFAHPSLTSDELIALNDSLKTYGGGTMWFLPGQHLVDSTIHFGPNCHYKAYPGSLSKSNDKHPIPVVALNQNISQGRIGLSLFAPDSSFYDSDNVNPWSGQVELGYINNIVIEGLRISVSTGPAAIPLSDSKPWVGIDFRGVNSSRAENNELYNFMFPIVVGANACDSIFFIDDDDGETKSWRNVIRGNEIINTYWQNNWATVLDTVKAYGISAITAVTANGVEISRNSIAFIGAKIFVPLTSSAHIFGNLIETSAAQDTIAPWVIIGGWQSPPGIGIVDYDSTHIFVNAESLDCAEYNYNPSNADLNVWKRGAKNVSFYNNRFESGNNKHPPNLYIGANARSTSVYGNNFSRNVSSGAADHFAVRDYGEGTEWGINSWPADGRDEDWGFGEKALYHAIFSRPNGGPVYLGPSKYTIRWRNNTTPAGYLGIPSNIELVGVKGKTIIVLEDSLDEASWDDNRGIFSIEHQAENIAIRNIIFDANIEKQDFTSEFSNATLVFDNIIGVTIGETSGTDNDSIQSVVVEDCEFIGFVRGIYILDNEKHSDIVIRNSLFIPQIFLAGIPALNVETQALYHEL